MLKVNNREIGIGSLWELCAISQRFYKAKTVLKEHFLMLHEWYFVFVLFFPNCVPRVVQRTLLLDECRVRGAYP